MKRLVIPALSLVLLAGFPAQARPSGNMQIAQNQHSQNDQKDQKQGAGHQDRGHQGPTGGQGQSATHGGSQGGQSSSQQVQSRALKQGAAHENSAATAHARPTTATSPMSTMSMRRGSAHTTAGAAAVTTNKPMTQNSNRNRVNQDSNRGQTNQNFNRNNGNPNTAMQNSRHMNANRDNVRNFHRNFDAPRRYHAEAYRQPSGYQYRHWGYGERLPQSYFGRDYWIMDFLMYGLDEPPPGYVWVRYGPDALLIDQYDGEIVEVEYGVYY